MRSLKKMAYMAFAGVIILLVFVIILGIRQYRLTESYNAIITQSEEMIFQFATIREQITTSLIEKDWTKIISAADRLKNLNSTLARLQENSLIPGEYRLDMAKQLDLSGLAIASREILSSTDKTAYSLGLQNKMRLLAEYLMHFDRIIVSQTRAKVLQFQTVMIGALGAVICLLSFSLLFLHKRTMVPLFHMARQAGDSTTLAQGFTCSADACIEIVEVTQAVNSLLQAEGKKQPEPAGTTQVNHQQLATILNESTNLSNGIINYAQLLTDTYQEVGRGTEETKILQNIIDAAERVAQLNKKI